MYSLNQVKMLASCGRDPGRSLPLWRGFLLVPLILVCLALVPQMHAIVPPPDGGYPNFNTAEGEDALFFNTTASANTGIGWRSLYSDTTARFNTGCGGGTLALNNGEGQNSGGGGGKFGQKNGMRKTPPRQKAPLFLKITPPSGDLYGAFGALSPLSHNKRL